MQTRVNLTHLKSHLKLKLLTFIGIQARSKRIAKLKNKKLFQFFNDISLDNIIVRKRLILDICFTNKPMNANFVECFKKLENLMCLSIDFKYNYIGESGAKFLSEALLSCQNLNSLKIDLNFNNVKESGIMVLTRSISKISQLVNLSLNLFYNKVEESGVFYLAHALTSLKKLQNLNINLDQNNIGDLGAFYLAYGLSALNNLACLVLSLHFNKIGEQGLLALSQGIKKLPFLNHLSLILSLNEIENKSTSVLSETIANKTKNLKKLELDMESNKISDDGVKLLCETKHLQHVGDIKLKFENNKISPKSKSQLLEVYGKNVQF